MGPRGAVGITTEPMPAGRYAGMAHAHRWRRRIVSGMAALATLSLVAPPASAAPPPNDKLRHAIEIPAIPYLNEQSTLEAGSDGPRFCSNNGSVFYRFTATETRRLQADTLGSDYDTVLGVFTGGRFDAAEVACNDDRYGLDSAVRFRAEAGQTYSFMVGYCCGNGGDDVDQNGNLVFTLDRARKDAPLSVDVTVDADATLHADGTIDVTGSASCTARSGIAIDGALRQHQGDVSVRGGFFTTIACDPSGPTEWTATVTPRSGQTFGPDDAKVRYSVSADSWDRSLFIRGLASTVTVGEA